MGVGFLCNRTVYREPEALLFLFPLYGHRSSPRGLWGLTCHLRNKAPIGLPTFTLRLSRHPSPALVNSRNAVTAGMQRRWEGVVRRCRGPVYGVKEGEEPLSACSAGCINLNMVRLRCVDL